MRSTLFGETVGDMEAEALVKTMHQSLAEVEAEKPFYTLRDVETKALADTLAERLLGVKAERVGETLMHLKAASLV